MSEKEKLKKLFQKLYFEIRKNIIEDCNNREYKAYGYNSGVEFLEEVETNDDLENTIREQGYLRGIERGFDLIFNNLTDE